MSMTALQLIQEATYKYGYAAVNLPAAQADYVIKWGRQMIANEDLYYDEEGGCGRESEPHVTALYGLTDKEPSEELLKLVRETPPFTVRLTGITLFENEKYDVVKFDVDSEELVALSNAIRAACPNENKYPKYEPHCTVAYVKKGRAADLAGLYPFEADPPISAEFEVSEIIFKPAGDSGDPKRKTTIIPLNRFVKEAEDPKSVLRAQPHSGYKIWDGEDMWVRWPLDARNAYPMTNWIHFRGKAHVFASRVEAEHQAKLYTEAGYNTVVVPADEKIAEAVEDPKAVFYLAKAAIGRWAIARGRDAYGKVLPNKVYLKIIGEPSGQNAVWTTNLKQATQFVSDAGAWSAFKAVFGEDPSYWNGSVATKPLDQSEAKLEAEDPKSFLRQARPYAWVAIRWLDQYGKEHITRYSELSLHSAEEELKKNLGLNRSPYVVVKVLEIAPYSMAEAKGAAPFDLMRFPTDPSVLAAKLLELEVVEEPVVL